MAMLEYPGALPIALGAVGLVTLALIAREGWFADGILWIRRWAVFLVLGWVKWFEDAASAREWCRSNLSLARIGRGARKWLIPLLLSLVFVVLFAIANPIIENWLEELDNVIATMLKDLFRWVSYQRILLWLLVGTWGLALLRLRTKLDPHRKSQTIVALSFPRSFLLPDPIVRCLFLFNAVFAVQTILDIAYLWGGAQLPQGMTYASYAHRGAYPLVATALLAALFVLATFRSGSNGKAMHTARLLVYLWLAQNVFLVLSAAWRLNLYIDIYSLTRLRAAAAIWMLLVAMGLVYICWRIISARTNTWLVNVNLLTLLGVLFVCSFVNWDSMIASYNVRHCKEATGEGVPIDLAYLQELGPESLPALLWLIDNAKEARVQGSARERMYVLTVRLAEDLRNWRGWCYRRHRLVRGLQNSPDYAKYGISWTTAQQWVESAASAKE
jgi:hypothetical protein